MKISRYWLGVSLALNLALALAVWLRFPTADGSGTDIANVATSASRVAAPTPSVDARPLPTATSSPRAPLWPAGESREIAPLIARLRAAGCSPREIVAVLSAMITQRGEALLAKRYADTTYWSTPRPPDSSWQVAIATQWLVEQKLVSQYLLSPELFGADEELVDQLSLQYGELPLEKLRQLSLLENAREQESLQWRLDHPPSDQPGETRYGANAEAERARRRQFEAAVRTALTPEEYASYELRSSNVARGLRSRLESFRPSEAEYKALFAIEKARRDGAGAGNPTPVERDAPTQALNARLTEALGSARAADYLALQKSNSSDLPRLLARLDLPLATLGTVTTVRDDAGTAAQAIRENPQLTAAERTAQLSTLARKTASDLTAALGVRGYVAYLELKGDWLRELENPVPPPPPSP